MQDAKVPGGFDFSPLGQLWAVTATEGCIWRKDIITHSEYGPNILLALFLSIAIGKWTSVNLS